MTTIIYWFRNDLRLEDNPAFKEACRDATLLLPIYIHANYKDELTHWGFPRIANHAKAFLQESLKDLRSQLAAKGSTLLEFKGNAIEIMQVLRDQIQSGLVYCEQIEAPEEIDQVTVIEGLGFKVKQFWQSSMLDPRDLPFDLKDMPDIFTRFRQDIEREDLSYALPIVAPEFIPPLPCLNQHEGQQGNQLSKQGESPFIGGERSGLAHLSQYLDRRLPDTYKQTRNQLMGMEYSSKFSPWLSLGCLSPRVIADRLKKYESIHGANDGTYWLWFELLWRDYFRFLHFKYGKKLYQPKGLGKQQPNSFHEEKFYQWSSGLTGEDLVDAGMGELQQTGFLSNRMRQVLASYWIYDMKGDWRAGAAWFESQLIDYDVYSNQGNWLYISGGGTDPRGGRPFNVQKQAKDHDPDGVYRAMWLAK